MDDLEPIIGLKTTSQTSVDPKILDSIFSDDESADFDFSDSLQAPLCAPMLVSKHACCPVGPTTKERIENLCEATPRITSFLASLEQGSIPSPFVGELYFIPENTVPESVTRLLNDLYHDRDKDIIDQILEIDLSAFPDTVLAQFELIKWLHDRPCNLSHLLTKRMDSRITSLIHFALSKTDDLGLSASHLLSAIEEMIKFPALAPLSVFFDGFSLEDLVNNLGETLKVLFPRNPILPSVILKLSKFAPNLSMEAVAEQESDGDDFSDDFFDDIEQLKTDQTTCMFQGLFQTEIRNPLGQDNEITKSITMINEPPATATYLLDDGSDRMAPMKFKEWILSCRCDRNEMLKQANGLGEFKNRKQRRMRDKTIQSDPLVGLSLNSEEKVTETEDFQLANLYRLLDQPQLIVSQMPSGVPLDEVSLYLPLAHTINASTAKAMTAGFMYPRILINEFDVHVGLLHDDVACVDRSLAYFSSTITEELKKKSETMLITPMKEKRQPSPMIAEAPPTLSEALAAVDYEFACQGRSPLTGATIGRSRNDIKDDVILSDPYLRGRILYCLYTTENFSPYVAFRLAFALALNLMETEPGLAASFMFEGLYTLLNAFKFMKVIPIVRFGFLCFAEMLDKLNSFYYGVIALDNFFVADPTDASYSSAIAQMCVRNKDYLRAVFHYTEGLRKYVKSGQQQEALFVAQVLAGIYTDTGLNTTAISLLSFLLYRTYSIKTICVREKGTTTNFGSLKMMTKRVETSSFQPDAKSWNTVVLATQLIELLIKRRAFDLAELLLGKVEEMALNRTVQRRTKACRAHLYLKKNAFSEFLAAIPSVSVSSPRTRFHTPTSSVAASTSELGSLKLLAVGHIIKRHYCEGLFWSEMFLYVSSNVGVKNLGYGYFLRGIALGMAYQTGKDVIEFSDEFPCNQGRDKIGFAVQKSMHREDVFREGLASFMMAKQCFECVGAVLLQVKAYLFFTELLLRKITPDSKDFSIEVSAPKQVYGHSSGRNVTASLAFTPFVAKLETLSLSQRAMDKLIERLMNPWDVITYQVFLAKIYFLKDEIETAKQYFDFAVDNLTRYFCCGVEFLPKLSSVKKMMRFSAVLEHACDVLLWFDPDYINRYLFVFDIMNDVRRTVETFVKEPAPTNAEVIRPSIDITEQILDLGNPHLPEFKSLLEENGYISKTDDTVVSPGIEDMMKQIAANIHLFESGKFSEDELTMKNTMICRRIEARAETLRRQKSSQIPAESEFSFALRTCPYAEGCVFVQRIFEKVVVYVPKVGRKRVVDINAVSAKATIKDEDTNKEIEFSRMSKEIVSLFSSLISEKAKPISPKIFSQMRTWFFGNMSFPTFRVVNDDRRFAKSRVSRKTKGSLATMDCGNSPVILIASVDLQKFPFEMMLQDTCVIRKPSYTSLLRRPPQTMPAPKFTILKSLFTDTFTPAELLSEASYPIGADLPLVTSSRKYISEFLWFAAKKDTAQITRKYPFLNVVKLPENEMPRLTGGSQVLVLLTYTDLFHIPRVLDKIFREYPFASFMFVPRSVCGNALKLIRAICERHVERVRFFEKNQGAEGIQSHMALVTDGFTNVTTIQQTLMKELKVPIPIFLPV